MLPLITLSALGVLAVVGSGATVYFRKRRRQARALYEQQLEQALADDIMTPEEARQLAALKAEKDLSDAEVRMVALMIYRRVLREVAADARFTAEDEERLRKLHHHLGLSAEDLEADRDQLHRLWLLALLERGRLPEIRPPIALAQEETCHWAVRATLCDRVALPAPRRATPAHLVFEADADEPFQAMGDRDFLDADPQLLPQDLGMLVITSRRTVFRGAKRQVVVPHVHVRRVALFRDAVRLEVDSGDSRLVLVEDSELTAAILLAAARRRRREIAGTSPVRSA